MSLENTKKWFEQAIPEPTASQACIQVGCHYEEVAEMMEALADDGVGLEVTQTSDQYKLEFEEHFSFIENLSDEEKIQLLDSLADQIVTAVGVAHMLGMDILGALEEVNRSNFSKFENGNPVFDANGKITKGKNYVKPNLERFV